MTITRVPTGGTAQGETVTVHTELCHLCPFRDEVDQGHITVSWLIDGYTFELHDLAAYFATFGDMKISHEELTGRIAAELGGSVVNVTTHWQTAGMAIAVSRDMPAPIEGVTS